jgi:putative SOS response-associated peptidase YedK
MCFFMQISKDATELKHRFNARFENEVFFNPVSYNGFIYPKVPVIASDRIGTIQFFEWGLIPSWAKNDEIRKNTLNARIETITEKPSFRNVVHNRCLVIADSFFEWQWLDEKGKQKQKYQILLRDHSLFAFAGLYNQWADSTSGEVKNTFTILTTEADELMSKIHNSKKRMPVILNPSEEAVWLQGKWPSFPKIELIANPI